MKCMDSDFWNPRPSHSSIQSPWHQNQNSHPLYIASQNNFPPYAPRQDTAATPPYSNPQYSTSQDSTRQYGTGPPIEQFQGRQYIYPAPLRTPPASPSGPPTPQHPLPPLRTPPTS